MNKENAVIIRQKMMLSMFAKHSRTIKETTNMIIVEEKGSSLLNAEIIVETLEKALGMLGFSFMNVAKASGLIDDKEWQYVTGHLSRLIPTEE